MCLLYGMLSISSNSKRHLKFITEQVIIVMFQVNSLNLTHLCHLVILLATFYFWLRIKYLTRSSNSCIRGFSIVNFLYYQSLIFYMSILQLLWMSGFVRLYHFPKRTKFPSLDQVSAEFHEFSFSHVCHYRLT